MLLHRSGHFTTLHFWLNWLFISLGWWQKGIIVDSLMLAFDTFISGVNKWEELNGLWFLLKQSDEAEESGWLSLTLRNNSVSRWLLCLTHDSSRSKRHVPPLIIMHPTNISSTALSSERHLLNEASKVISSDRCLDVQALYLLALCSYRPLISLLLSSLLLYILSLHYSYPLPQLCQQDSSFFLSKHPSNKPTDTADKDAGSRKVILGNRDVNDGQVLHLLQMINTAISSRPHKGLSQGECQDMMKLEAIWPPAG